MGLCSPLLQCVTQMSHRSYVYQNALTSDKPWGNKPVGSSSISSHHKDLRRRQGMYSQERLHTLSSSKCQIAVPSEDILVIVIPASCAVTTPHLTHCVKVTSSHIFKHIHVFPPPLSQTGSDALQASFRSVSSSSFLPVLDLFVST